MNHSSYALMLKQQHAREAEMRQSAARTATIPIRAAEEPPSTTDTAPTAVGASTAHIVTTTTNSTNHNSNMRGALSSAPRSNTTTTTGRRATLRRFFHDAFNAVAHPFTHAPLGGPPSLEPTTALLVDPTLHRTIAATVEDATTAAHTLVSVAPTPEITRQYSVGDSNFFEGSFFGRLKLSHIVRDRSVSMKKARQESAENGDSFRADVIELESAEDDARQTLEDTTMGMWQGMYASFLNGKRDITAKDLWDFRGEATSRHIENMYSFLFRQMRSRVRQNFLSVFRVCHHSVLKNFENGELIARNDYIDVPPSAVSPPDVAGLLLSLILIDMAITDDDVHSFALTLFPGQRVSLSNCPPSKRFAYFSFMAFKSTTPYFNTGRRIDAFREYIGQYFLDHPGVMQPSTDGSMVGSPTTLNASDSSIHFGTSTTGHPHTSADPNQHPHHPHNGEAPKSLHGHPYPCAEFELPLHALLNACMPLTTSQFFAAGLIPFYRDCVALEREFIAVSNDPSSNLNDSTKRLSVTSPLGGSLSGQTRRDSNVGMGASSDGGGSVVRGIRYQKAQELGRGAYGVVFLAVNVSDGKMYAIKELKIPKEKQHGRHHHHHHHHHHSHAGGGGGDHPEHKLRARRRTTVTRPERESPEVAEVVQAHQSTLPPSDLIRQATASPPSSHDTQIAQAPSSVVSPGTTESKPRGGESSPSESGGTPSPPQHATTPSGAGHPHASSLLPSRHHSPHVESDKEKQVRAEVNMLSRLRHPNIISYYGCDFDYERGVVTILMEYAQKSLRSIVDSCHGLHEQLVAHYARQILQGLSYLHDNHIIHRDIKAANILVTEHGEVKVTDFGTAMVTEHSVGPASEQPSGDYSRQEGHVPAAAARPSAGSPPSGAPVPTRTIAIQGTPLFLAPEVVQGCMPLEPSDIWSFGCVLIELASGEAPWREHRFQNVHQLLFHIATSKESPQLPSHVHASPIFLEFLNACLNRDPCQRPSARMLLRHPFLKQTVPTAPPSSATAAAPLSSSTVLNATTRSARGHGASLTALAVPPHDSPVAATALDGPADHGAPHDDHRAARFAASPDPTAGNVLLSAGAVTDGGGAAAPGSTSAFIGIADVATTAAAGQHQAHSVDAAAGGGGVLMQVRSMADQRRASRKAKASGRPFDGSDGDGDGDAVSPAGSYDGSTTATSSRSSSISAGGLSSSARDADDESDTDDGGGRCRGPSDAAERYAPAVATAGRIVRKPNHGGATPPSPLIIRTSVPGEQTAALGSVTIEL